MGTTEDDLEDRIHALVAEQSGVSTERIRPETDVIDDLRIYGDDVWELLEKFGKQFHVEMQGLRWYHHSGPEGCNPVWLLFPTWWAGKTHVPIRLSDLVESARSGVWAVKYPEEERED
jgi:hypothetical protein